jgi:ribonuclease HI
MAKATRKWYVVLVGRQPGIYSTWNECKQQVDSHPAARYKAYESLDEAKSVYAAGKIPYVPKVEGQPAAPKVEREVMIARDGFEPDSLSVDAACSGNPGIMEYRGIDNLTGIELFKTKAPILATNNVGEFLAIVHALAFLKGHTSGKTIYSDSVNAINWVKAKTVRSKLLRTADTATAWQLMERAVIWLQNNTYPNAIKKWETTKWGENPADFGRK